ncbi:hypothetical protein KCV87_24710 [Actinosynnema pretiosum subsp. pretiosum]|uniref:Uncharacterized protein n=2 Tax=Actinosynnema TaxID=40566 RepID=C6WIW5_ACTMD|nr:hypothetical protein [Actinosynnema mirum]ACU40041.1 hypothetical protein Amir_6237 [Actinosynnema mirum DSM 43827]AXX33567.1 hypothetical protein APASM_6202 [Actinosynnema pretiosum subsp. pretiosum]QUF02639.1 hypothetical protein KCV87_24710 [Actinosynnema pretiosum subsp. pretiosum]
MHPQQDPDRWARLHAVAGEALAATKVGEDAVAVDLVTGYLSGSPEGDEDIRELVLLLFSECSGMVSALGSGGATPVKMQVFDEAGQEVPIDDADPPVRTAIRALLAEVHGDQEAAAEQIEIALANGAPQELATVVLQALRWTVKLALECQTRDLPVSEWIATSLEE